jgi:very-short-patch-repair endonuclease
VAYSKHCAERELLWKNINAYIQLAKQNGWKYNASPIQIISCKNNDDALQKAELFKQKGLYVKAILSPTVPQGQERIRVCLHSFNEGESIENIFTHLSPPSREEKTSPLEGRLRGVTYSNNFYNKNLKPLARKKRSEMTKSEVKIWKQLLRNKQCFGYKFLRQRTIENYIVDFFCAELNLVIEVDGYSHLLEETYEKDVERQSRLEALGFNVLRFTDNQVMNDFENVYRALELFIESCKK